MTNAASERAQISKQFDRAARAKESRSDDATEEYLRADRKARAALQAWREKYPEEAAAEDAAKADRVETERVRHDVEVNRPGSLADLIRRGLD